MKPFWNSKSTKMKSKLLNFLVTNMVTLCVNVEKESVGVKRLVLLQQWHEQSQHVAFTLLE